MRRLAARLFCALALLSASCTLMVSGCEMNGRVVDSETGAPVPGALVIAQWSGDVGGPVQSSHVCFHLEVATTDAEGRYHIPSWARRPVTDWEGGFFGVRNVEVTRGAYKAGYVQLGPHPDNEDTIPMRMFRGTAEERIRYLAHEGTNACGRYDGSRAYEKILWKAICDEAKGLMGSTSDVAIRGGSFLREIDQHLAFLSQDVKDGVARHEEIPRVCK